MKRNFFLFAFVICSVLTARSQLMVSKLFGKNSENTGLGYGVFAAYDFPLNDEETRSVRLELLDFAYFPAKDPNMNSILGYLSIKLGYKYIFSQESKTGFYLEPAAGYCRVVKDFEIANEAKSKDGVAVALEAGYSVEVGQGGNNFDFGLKYERDMAGEEYTINSVGLRVSFSFHLFKRRER